LRAFTSSLRRLLVPAALIGLATPAHASLWEEIRLPGAQVRSAPYSVAISSPQSPGQSSGPYVITPERRALLNTIRFAEGTWANGEDRGYWIMFGGGLMPSLERHPNRVIYSSRYASAAAGAYQFMPFTWELASRSLGLGGFGPSVQDQAAIFLIQRRGALELADRGEMTPELAAKLAPEWASFPTLAGQSFYGQPVKRFAQLQAFYEANLAELRASINQAPSNIALAEPATPPPPAVCPTPGSLACALEQTSTLRR
jgi:lysozyme